LQERGGAGGENEEEFAGVAFGAGEVNWWSGLEERKNIKNQQSIETSCVAGFFTEETSRLSSKEERQNQERNQQEPAEPETPLTTAVAQTAGEKRRIELW
jgi:hypothetical protein